MRYLTTIFLAIIFTVNPNIQDDGLTRLLRFPDISKDKIAFVYAGDIWIVDANGGTAKHLTSHKGIELFPKFLPMVNGLHSQVNIQATGRFILFLLKEEL